MENKLEQLLKSLIEKGWLPRGEDKIHSCKFDKRENKFMANYTRSGCFKVMYRSLTELCSKSSGLWQFVCENGMVNINYGNIREYYSEQENGGIYIRKLNGEDNYGYRLIESALRDESELEEFLLQNIKVEG